MWIDQRLEWSGRTASGKSFTWVSDNTRIRFSIWKDKKSDNYRLNIQEFKNGPVKEIAICSSLEEAKGKATAISINGGLPKERIEYTVPEHVKIKKLRSGRAFGATDLTQWSANVKAGIYGPPIAETGRVRHIFCRKCSMVTKVRVKNKHIKVPWDFTCPGCGSKSARIAKHKERSECNSVTTKPTPLAR